MLTPHFLTDKLLTGAWLHENHKFWKHFLTLFHNVHLSASGCSWKMRMLSVRATREQVIHCTSTSASGQRTLGKWCSVKSEATTSLAARNSLHSLPSVALTLDYDVSSYINAYMYFHLIYFFKIKFEQWWISNSHWNCWNNVQMPLYTLIRFDFQSTRTQNLQQPHR